jgi:hypothetical protein
MSYTESDIAHEVGKFWVLRDRPQKAYAVCISGITHSVVDSAYELNEDGLSIAIARCNYLANRATTQSKTGGSSVETKLMSEKFTRKQLEDKLNLAGKEATAEIKRLMREGGASVPAKSCRPIQQQVA